ncbi:DUF1836 domain-containing protein [Bacillus sp. 31A1R]|uniref:DUF1836 domain-containing protein n=1 Tax=Robertmurraya mangrovi TaxID=3098077 RepID=A0ABU5ITK8_9BACI|nr:DUF1836 domain-containing protein [Bacillus sp. 31A1R]MDZ5470458.1 DUF1836 domain-containing protein [Bacillus sp. 31A1R]
MEKLIEMIEKLELENQLSLEEMPEIDLYMDQVIQLFENKFAASKRNEDEKVLTKTMINNYAKGKLFIPIKNKKYTKEHLILISLIYQLKGALSINDIKVTLEEMNKLVLEGDVDIKNFYQTFLQLSSENVEKFQDDIKIGADHVEEKLANLEGNSDYLQKMLLITSFVHMSNLYRRVAEKLVDEIIEEK